jgi:hypothetical protein
MASTIILKHGSGSNSPSSLTQGELAINIATGKLFYGTKDGTSVSSSFTFSNITSSGNISASGNIIGSTSYFSRTIITLNSTDLAAEASPFIISIANNNGQDEKLQVNHEGVLRFGALTTLPTAITGGLVYSASNFYMGIS